MAFVIKRIGIEYKMINNEINKNYLVCFVLFELLRETSGGFYSKKRSNLR